MKIEVGEGGLLVKVFKSSKCDLTHNFSLVKDIPGASEHIFLLYDIATRALNNFKTPFTCINKCVHP